MMETERQDCTFRDGWMRFWGTFARPYPVMLGFCAATIASRSLYRLLETIVLAVYAVFQP
jgi:hypothetical protein